MKLNIFNVKTKALGLQFGDNVLRALELRGSSVQAATEATMAKGIVQNDTVISGELLSSTVKKMFENPTFGRFNTRNVVVSLPETKCFVRVIHMQHMSDSEVDSAIPYEAESYVPIPIDQVYLDWQKLSETDGRMEILLVASPKEYVDKIVSAIESAGLVPCALEVESQSLARLAIPATGSQNMVIANIKGSNSDLVMVERGNVQFTSTVPIGGISVTDALARGLGITSQAAEQIKVSVGIANTAEYPTLESMVAPALNNFVSEVKNILTFHGQHSQEKISQLALMGGGAQLLHLDEFLSRELTSLGIQVTMVDPLKVVKPPHTSAKNPFPALAYSTVIGLALRPLD